MTNANTKGLSPEQAETVTRLVMSHDRLLWILPFLAGIWINAVLFGVFMVLAYRWQMTVARTEKRWVKGTVYFLIILHLGATGYSIAYQQYMFAVGFGQYRSFVNVSWMRPSFVLKLMSRLACSIFFIHRAWLVYKRHWAVLALMIPLLLAFTACSAGVIVTCEYMPLPPVTRRWILGMDSSALAIDVSLTILLAVALQRSRSSFDHTNRLIGRIIRTVVETQTPPTITALLQVIVTARWGDTSQVAWFHFVPRVSAICLLIVLNARQEYSLMSQAHPPTSAILSRGAGTATRSHHTGVLVDRVTHVDVHKLEDWHPYPFAALGADKTSTDLPSSPAFASKRDLLAMDDKV